MGGEIGVDSTIGVGSTFWLSIPVKMHGSEESKKAKGEIENLRALILQSGASTHLMLVSPSDATLLWLSNILTGFKLTLLKSIEEIGPSIQQAEADQEIVAFILVDDQSERNVEEVINALRARDSSITRDTKIIHVFTPTSEFLSNHRSGRVDQAGLVRITKPVRTLRLLQTIAHLKNIGTSTDAGSLSETLRLDDPKQEGSRRTLFGNVLIAEGKYLCSISSAPAGT